MDSRENMTAMSMPLAGARKLTPAAPQQFGDHDARVSIVDAMAQQSRRDFAMRIANEVRHDIRVER